MPRPKICAGFCNFLLDNGADFGIIVNAVTQDKCIWSSIEVVITSTTGNRVAVLSGSRVRIPPTPPKETSETVWFRTFLVFEKIFPLIFLKSLDFSRKYLQMQSKTRILYAIVLMVYIVNKL